MFKKKNSNTLKQECQMLPDSVQTPEPLPRDSSEGCTDMLSTEAAGEQRWMKTSWSGIGVVKQSPLSWAPRSSQSIVWDPLQSPSSWRHHHLVVLLLFYGCYSKSPQTWRPKITHLFLLSSGGKRSIISWDQSVGRAVLPLGGSKRKISSLPLLGSGGYIPWAIATSSQFLPLWSQ